MKLCKKKKKLWNYYMLLDNKELILNQFIRNALHQKYQQTILKMKVKKKILIKNKMIMNWVRIRKIKLFKKINAKIKMILKC